MLKGDFFSIGRIQRMDSDDLQNSTADQYMAEIILDPGHSIYEGHFPGNPVVPGVCQLRMLTELLSEIEGREMIFQNASQMKFLSMINPHDQPELKVRIDLRRDQEESVKVTSSIFAGETVFFKCKAVYCFNCQ